MRLGWWKTKTRPKASHQAATVAPVGLAPARLASTAPAKVPVQQANTNPAAVATPAPENKLVNPPAASRQQSSRLPEGGLRIYENGKEIFRVPPTSYDAATNSTDSGEQVVPGLQAASIVELSPDAAQSILLRRVEPQYPEQAIMRRIQGPVQLDVRMDRKGAVQDIKLMSGDPILGKAAIAAVRQWRFKPRKINGRAVEMQTQITLTFTLPSS